MFKVYKEYFAVCAVAECVHFDCQLHDKGYNICLTYLWKLSFCIKQHGQLFTWLGISIKIKFLLTRQGQLFSWQQVLHHGVKFHVYNLGFLCPIVFHFVYVSSNETKPHMKKISTCYQVCCHKLTGLVTEINSGSWIVQLQRQPAVIL